LAVSIRLRKHGHKKQPFYRIVVTDSRKPRDGRFIEIIGHYNPLTEPEQVDVNQERLTKWLGNGAQPSSTVKNLLKRKGIWKEDNPRGQNKQTPKKVAIEEPQEITNESPAEEEINAKVDE